MATIRTVIELQDGMTAPLNNMVNSLNHVISAFESMQNVNGISVDTSSISAARSEIQAATEALERLNSENATVGVDNDGGLTPNSEPIQVPVEPQAPDPLIDRPEPVEVPVTWNSNGFDVFTTSGAERYEQEVQSLNQYLQQLYGTQQRITQQAVNTDLFPENMVADLTHMQGKMEAIRAKVQQIEQNPLNMGSDEANSQLEQLRSQLHQMIDAQNDLNSAVDNMDVSAANSAYQRLSSTINTTEAQIRDNVDEQGRFTNEVKNSENAASGLMSTIKGVVAAYATIQTAKMVIDVSDTLTQTTARLNMMNDGLQTTEQLQQMIYAAAERSRGSYQATADAVSKMGIMARDAFNSNAELVAFSEQLNKQFTIAGTSAEGVSAAMLQLTQAMGSGVLRGEELNSVFEQAPTIIQTIADYLNVPIGQIRAMAQDGQLSATVVKNALLTAADETNAKFESMPKTFGQIWTSMQNQALMAFQPILQRLNKIANSKAFNTFVNNAVSALTVLAGALTTVFDIVVKVGAFFADNWSIIAPIIYGITAAVAAYTAVMLIHNAVQAISNAIKGIAAFQAKAHAAALMMEQGATFAATAAQYGLNAALYACPLTWIILLIIAIIALFYIVVAVINDICGTSVSATGIIMGLLATLGAYIFNCIAYWWNIISAFIEFFVNVWKNPEYAIKALLVNLINAFLNFCLAIVQGNGAAIGVIVGAWYAFCQIISNIVAAVYNFFAMCIEWIVNAWNQCVFAVQTLLYNISDAALGAAQGAASSMEAAATAIGNAFVSGANAAINAINWIIDAINMIPGVNIGKFSQLGPVSFNAVSTKIGDMRSNLSKPTAPETFTLDRMDFGSISEAYDMGNQAGQDFAAGFENTVADIQSGMQDWLGETPDDYWEAPKLDYINLGDAAKAGYEFGSGVEDKLSDFGNLDTGDMENMLNDIAANTGDGAGSGSDTADNTGKMADALDCTDEELKYLRDIAERDVINRFTTAELKVEIHSENNINSDMDIDGVVERFTEKVSEELEAVAEGVHV